MFVYKLRVRRTPIWRKRSSTANGSRTTNNWIKCRRFKTKLVRFTRAMLVTTFVYIRCVRLLRRVLACQSNYSHIWRYRNGDYGSLSICYAHFHYAKRTQRITNAYVYNAKFSPTWMKSKCWNLQLVSITTWLNTIKQLALATELLCVT